ncbi:hypothetical protein CFP65_4026 [Kitasatospora sp. MMS16-BH015]|uniref:GNAT family N-acetyltransferase n=1 Tax=Kitasatospora sp. MMS16-BH015 TaxID=2018025 RepID=UPI000CA15CD0|nr:GNAT family N-acetyltransferase [Kitasatospora sp. MMS16-BH015]AUG78793.1 hypothetical protein CFP65_4026 [Kitasatospora sp. MMS16-BH015]
MSFITGAIRHSHRISEVAAAWDSVANDLYSLPNWLATAEARAPGRCHYAVLSEADGTPQGGLVAYETGPDGWHFANPVALLARSTEAVAEHLDSAELAELTTCAKELTEAQDQLHPALACYLPSGYRPGLLPGPDPAGTVTEALLDQLDALAAEGGYPTAAVLHVPERASALRERLERRGYLPFVAVGDCVLHTPWADFGGYLGSLKSHRRTAVRREIRAFAESGAELRETGLDSLGEAHALLHAGHMRRYGHPAEPAASRQLITSIQTHRTGTGRVFEAWRGTELIGFVVCYQLGDVFYPKMIGVAEGEKRSSAYFNLTYYEPVRVALAEGIRQIVYGPEAYGAKALRGCALERLVSHVRLPAGQRTAGARAAALVDLGHRRRMDRHDWAQAGADADAHTDARS